MKQFLKLSHCVFWTLHTVSNSPTVLVDLVIVTSLVGLVAEKVDSCVVRATERLLCFKVLETIGFVPACWKDVKGNLTTNGETARDNQPLPQSPRFRRHT